MASRFDYTGKVTGNFNKKKKRVLDRPKEKPVGQPKQLVQPQRTISASNQAAKRASIAGSIKSESKPKARTGVSNTPKARPAMQSPPRAATTTRVSVGPRPAQAATRTGTGNGGLRMPKVSVSISNETAIGRGLNRIFTGSPNRTVEERRKRWQGIQSRAGNR